jgi:hypothetical protein
MFFEPRRRPIELEPQRVLALRPSLNTPVISVSELPVGPACAAILVHMEPGQGLQINVGVRSLGCGSVTVFGFDQPISAGVVNVALDAALSFAESMGFLFDDDMVDDDAGSQEKAVLRWREMIGEVAGEGGPLAPAADADELFDADGGELTDPPEPAPAPEPEPTPTVALTKFRSEPTARAEAVARAEAREAASTESSRRALGRVRLVKRASRQQAQDARRAWLLRLLTSF